MPLAAPNLGKAPGFDLNAGIKNTGSGPLWVVTLEERLEDIVNVKRTSFYEVGITLVIYFIWKYDSYW